VTPAAIPHDADWLRRRYLDDRATVAEIAAGAGASEATIYGWLARYDIPARGRGDGTDWSTALTPAYLAARTASGLTPVEIAREAGCDAQSVRDRLRMAADMADTDLIAEYMAGRSLAEIAAERDLSRRTVTRRLHASGVVIRPTGRPGR
jgi:DNA-binding CsgD family transcriptional regulator